MLAAGGIAGPGIDQQSHLDDPGSRVYERSHAMKRMMPVAELARDDRFVRSSIEDRLTDPRSIDSNMTDDKGPQRQPGHPVTSTWPPR